MKGCPHCDDFKKMLKNEKIKFTNRDVEKHSDEYELFVSVTNDFVPAFMIINMEEPNKSELFAPDLHFNDLEEGLKIIKEKL
jgi:glutaredoxin